MQYKAYSVLCQVNFHLKNITYALNFPLSQRSYYSTMVFRKGCDDKH